MKKEKPFAKQTAFTLIELVITLLILGILSSYVLSKFTSTAGYKENTVVDQVISSARLAQQLSMNDSERTFSLIIQTNQIDLQVDGVSLSVGNTNYPIAIDNSVTLSPASVINFDQLGTTNFLILSVNAETTQQIVFETSGYIHQ